MKPAVNALDVKAGSIGRMKAHIHIGKNMGDTDTGVIMVESEENETLDKADKNLK
jgi:hypothetical protein